MRYFVVTAPEEFSRENVEQALDYGHIVGAIVVEIAPAIYIGSKLEQEVALAALMDLGSVDGDGL